MSVSDSIIIGVISGILTSFVIFLAVQIFQRVLIPWYQSIIYSGIKIDGEWYAPPTPPSSQEINLHLTQSAYRIKGTASYVSLSKPGEEIRMFNVSGSLRDRFVQLVFTHIDKDRIGLGTFLLEVVGDGRTMEGGRSYCSISTQNTIVSTSIKFTRHVKFPEKLTHNIVDKS